MSLTVGIVGLPNVGKSTLFNALTKQSAKVQNVPFTTIEPNVGIVPVPDERLEVLAKISKSEKITPATIEFVDIAGLVKNAHKGEGLGNQFLSHIREVDAIAHVVRFFEDEKITHVEQSVDPLRDVEVINTELALADLATIEKTLERVREKAKGFDKEAMKQLPTVEALHKGLADGKQAREIFVGVHDDKTPLNPPLTGGFQSIVSNLLTAKPVLYIANVSEEQLQNPPQSPLNRGEAMLPLCVKIEQELVELSDEDRKDFLKEYNLSATGLERLIQESYKLLGLITFLTTGPKETRAWTVKRGSTAPTAAGKIHSDMERGFIRAETVSYKDLVAAGSYTNARASGKIRDEGKEYIVRDGDVMLFKFSV